MISTRLATDGEGRPVLVKDAATPDDVEALHREAAVLTAARHPGVVEAAEQDDGRLVLRWAGSRTLADLHPPVEHAAALAAALAATVGDLHAVGVRHGRITPRRVVLDGRGRPVLCGFGAAALRGETGPGRPTEADDVAGVGVVLRALVGADSELEPIPDRRLGRRGPWPGGSLRRALLTVADHATADDPARRPSARVLAASIAALVPLPPPAAPRRAVPARVALAGAAVVLAAVGVASIDGGAVAVRGRVPPTPAPVGEAIRAIECPTVVEPAVDHDGDGCLSPVLVGNGVVEVAGTRFGVGVPGDALAVGDWDCDGATTVAAVRPSTGEVFVFDQWAAPATDVVVPAVTEVPGAVRAQASDADGDGCPSLVVVDASGHRTTVPT